MNVYQHPTEQRTFYSADREPSLNLSVPVAHISGLNNFSLPRPMVVPPQQGQVMPNVNGSGPEGWYLASDMRAAYYGGTTLDGTGQAVGLLEFSGYNASDVTETFTSAGQTNNVPVNNVLLDGATTAPGSGDAEAEVVLDIVQAIGMAPGLSQVRVYIGEGEDDANILNSIATENIVKQIGCSWSWQPDDPGTDDTFFEELAAQGQSFFAASGDDGAYDSTISPFFYPAEDSYVTAVGGTDLTTSSAGGPWSSEVAWTYSGGGISPDSIAIPSWQNGLADASNGGSATLRNIPDVALEADMDNYLCTFEVCGGGWGGTSFAAPRWAGFTALINQQAAEAGTAPNGGIGFLNPPLYTLAEGTSYSNDLHDITSGNNDSYNQPVSYSAVAGYDLVTGWGTANGASLINDLAGPQVPGFWLRASTATVEVAPGSSSTTTLNITDAGGFTGNVTLAVSSTLPTGVTASWGTNPASGSSVLTLTAAADAPASNTNLTITGTSSTGSPSELTSTTTVALAVHTPTFLLTAAPTAVALNVNSNTTSGILVTPQFGFTGNVSLSISGLPSGVTASFSPTSTSGSSTLTLTAGASVTAGTSNLTITGTSGSLTVTTPLTLSIQGPSFSLHIVPSISMGQGASTSGSVGIAPAYGFSGSVQFSISGLPTGVTATFAPNPAPSGASFVNLTLTATSAAPVGSSTVTVTGTSGSLTETATFSLSVMAPAFTLIDGGPLNIGQGSSGFTFVDVEPEYGFSGNVTLSVTGLPAGVTALWSPNPTTGSSELTLVATSSAAVGSTTLTITGTSGSITATTTLTLGVEAPTFTLSGPGSATMGQGTSTSNYVSVNPAYGFNGSVTFSVTGLPAGVTASFSPNPTTSSTELMLTASTSTPVGSAHLTITGTSGSVTATTTLILTVNTPTFTLSAGSVTMGQGTSASSTVYVNGQYGFSGNVNLSVSGLPAGVTGSFSPNPTTGISTLTLTASSSASIGSSTVTITGTSGSITQTTTITLGVYQPSFTLSGGGSLSIGQGSSGTTYIDLYSNYGFAGNVNLSVSGLPSGVTASFSPNPVSLTGNGYSSALLTITASGSAATGVYALTITGTSGSLTQTATLSLGVYAQSFTLSAGSSGVGQGSAATSYVYIYSQYGFAGNVNLSVAGLPSGVTATFAQNPVTLPSGSNYVSTQLTLSTTSAAAPGQYNLTITGTSGSLTAATTITFGIYQPSFTLYSSLYGVSLNPGSATTGTVTVQPQYGFSGSVALSASGLPSGVTASFSPNPTTGTSTLTLTAAANAVPGTGTVTITGVSGSLTESVTFSLTINTPSFSIDTAPDELDIAPGGSGEATVSLIPQYGFAGSVSLTATGLPSGVTAAFSPNPLSGGNSLLTLAASNAAANGSATITITASSGSLSASSTLTLHIQTASAATSTTLQISAAGSPVQSVASGTVVTLSAAVSTGSTNLTSGQVSFCDAAAASCDSIHRIGIAQLTSAGTATVSFIPGMGSRSYRAVFLGTGNAAASASPAASLAVSAAQSTTATIAQSGTPGAYTLTSTVTGQGVVAPSGSVSFLDVTNSNAPVATSTLGNPSTTLSWSNPQSPTVGSGVVSIVAADFNGDGIPDLAVLNNYNGTVTTLLGNGNGTFTAVASTAPAGSDPQSMVVGDFNGDGKPDLAVVNFESSNITILLGNGDGTFTPTSVNPATAGYATSLVAGDFNRDGIEDIAALNSSGTVTVLLGNGDGTFTPSPFSPSLGYTPFALTAGDFNGDGILDLVSCSRYASPGALTLLVGNGDGSFTIVPGPAVGVEPDQIVVGDFNRDGKADLAVLNAGDGTISILLGNGDGTFTPSASPLSANNASAMVMADFNGDGIPDLALTGGYGYTILIFLGKGDGTFAAAASLSAAGDPTAIVAADFNGDGAQDLAVNNSFGANLSIYTVAVTQTVTATATGVSPLGTGNHTVDASYPGDTNYKSSLSPTTVLVAEKATPTVTVTPSSSSIAAEQPLTVAVAVGGGTGNPVPTGSVTLTSGSYSSSATTLSNGAATLSIPAGSLAAGTDTLTVAYTPDTAGSANYNPASGSGSVTIGKETPTVTVTPSASSIATEQPLTVTVAVSGGAGNPIPTGSVTLTGGTYSSAPATLSSGAATISIPAGSLPLGTDTLTVAYTPDAAGSANYSAASGTGSVIVGKATPTVTVTPSSSSITTEQPLIVIVVVSGGAGNPIPTGSVTLTSGNYSSAAATLSNGAATISIPAGSLAAGTDTLAVTYTPDTPGSANYITASGSSSVTINRIAPSVSAIPSASSITTAQPLTVTVAVTGGAGNPLPTGSVTLTSGSYTAAATLSNGAGSISIPAGSLAVGSDTLTVTYTPDTPGAATYTTASATASVTVTQAIGNAAASVTAAASPATITNLQTDVVTVTVTGGSGQPVPTGSVTLSSGSWTTHQALSSGTTTVNIPAGTFATGTDTITAAYTGDPTYGPVTATTTVTVAPVVMTAAAVAAVSPGSSTTGNLTLTAGSNYSGTLSLACSLSVSPAGAQSLPTCSLNPASVILASGGTATATLTINTTAGSSASLVTPSGFRLWGVASGGSALAMLLFFGIPARRRRWASMLVLLFVLVGAAGIGCGGGGHSTSTPPPATQATTAGTYTFVVKATDTSANVTLTQNVEVTVQ